MKQLTRYISLLLIAATFALSANAQKESEVVVKGNTYTYKPINWTITVPSGWMMTEEKKQKELNKTGSDMIEDATGTSVSMSGVTNLLGFGKDKQNTFQSVIEPYKGRSTQYWTKRHLEAAMLYRVMESQGMYCDTATTLEKIDGKVFQVIYVDIFRDKEKTTPVLGQKYYSLLVEDYKVLSAILTYSNDRDFNTMDKAWRKSVDGIDTKR